MAVSGSAGTIYASKIVDLGSGEAVNVADVITNVDGGGDVSVTSDKITDASTIGKNILTASGADAVRDAIGAGTSDFSGSYDDLRDKPTLLTIGTTSSTAKAGNYTPPNATHITKGLVAATNNIPDSEATTIEELVADFNSLLAEMRTAGQML